MQNVLKDAGSQSRLKFAFEPLISCLLLISFIKEGVSLNFSQVFTSLRLYA